MDILDSLFPKFCIVCSKRGSFLCEECIKSFKRVLPRCRVCKRLSNDFETHLFCGKRDRKEYVCWYEERYFRDCFNKQSEIIQEEVFLILKDKAREYFNIEDAEIRMYEKKGDMNPPSLIILFGRKA